MIAYIALSSPGGGADRAKLSGLLWSESADAKTSLRQCIKEVRRSFADAGLHALTADNYRIYLDLSALWVDALEVDRLARSSAYADLDEMAALYAGDLLEGVPVHDPEFDEWLVVERTRLRQQVCRALEGALGRSLDERDLDRLSRTAEALLSLEPAHEEAHRALMRRHGLRGDVASAVRQYQTCRETLARALDVAPSAETEALLREIRSGARRGDVPRPAPAGPVLASPGVPARGPSRASVAVEHRVPVAGDAADEAVVAALAASLRQALSRMRWLSVLAPGPAPLIGMGEASGGVSRAAVGPHYRVSIALLRARDRVRFIAELHEDETGRILWSQHYDRALGGDVFGTVDDLAAALASRLDREVELAEIIRASRKPVEALSAYDCILRAIPLIFKLTPESFAEADRLLRDAQEADPHDALVYAWRAFWSALNIGQNWVQDLGAVKEELGFLVRRAIELDPKNGYALAVAGHVASFVNHDYEHAMDLIKQSIRIDPASIYARDFGAVTLCYAGSAKEALGELEASREYWERHPAPFYVQTTACIASFLAGEHEQAVALSRRTVRDNPYFEAPYRPLIAGLGLLGEVEEARQHLAALRQLQPDFSIGWFRACYPPLRKEDQSRYIEGLRRAGVEE